MDAAPRPLSQHSPAPELQPCSGGASLRHPSRQRTAPRAAGSTKEGTPCEEGSDLSARKSCHTLNKNAARAALLAKEPKL